MRTLFTIWKYSLLSVMAYRTSFLIQSGFMIVNDTFFLYIWYLFFQRFHTVGGLTFEQYVPLFAFFGIVFAFAHIFMEWYESLNRKIRDGALDSELLLPWALLPRLLVSSASASAIGDAFFAVIVLFVLTPNIVTPIFLLKFFFLWILWAITFISTTVIYHSLAFYMRSSERIADNSADVIFGPSFYPQSIFEGTVLKIMYLTIFPTFFITYYPYNFLMDDMDITSCGLTVFWAIFFSFLASFAFYHGLKRYESGNIVQTRV